MRPTKKKCKICGSGFASKQALLKHEIRVHKHVLAEADAQRRASNRSRPLRKPARFGNMVEHSDVVWDQTDQCVASPVKRGVPEKSFDIVCDADSATPAKRPCSPVSSPLPVVVITHTPSDYSLYGAYKKAASDIDVTYRDDLWLEIRRGTVKNYEFWFVPPAFTSWTTMHRGKTKAAEWACKHNIPFYESARNSRTHRSVQESLRIYFGCVLGKAQPTVLGRNQRSNWLVQPSRMLFTTVPEA